MPNLFLSTFSCDVTPPLGHPLCGGWIEPVRGVDDPLKAQGVILLGSGAPVVLCAVDWCGLRNGANLAWREALAKAAHTTAERVAVHCVHPHDAPFADTQAEEFLRAAKAPTSLDLKFFRRAVDAVAAEAKRSLGASRRFTHIGTGAAKVEEVASNRRVVVEGKVKFTRTSATKSAVARAEPEGLIDPWLRTLSFWDGKSSLAALHYYATHPMSHYGKGRVSCDFCGLAREKRAGEGEKAFQAYFNGCGGNVTAGKYNDGEPKNREILRDRIHAGMVAAWKATERHTVESFAWRVEPVKFSARREPRFGEAESKALMEDAKATAARRNNAAFQLAWLRRLERPVEITCLDFGPAKVLHLPGEPFVEYQLAAQGMSKDRFVCVAGYGDGGMGYIPTDAAFLEGGYEPTVALAAPCEKVLKAAMAKVLGVK